MPSFFDFLDQDVQEAPSIPTSPIGPQYQEFKRAEYQKKRAALGDAIRQRAHDYLTELTPISQRSPEGTPADAGSIRERINTIPPENIPGEVEKFVTPYLGKRAGGFERTFDPTLQKLGTEYLKLEATPEAEESRATLAKQDEPHLQGLRAGLERIKQDLPFVTTEAEKKQFAEQRKVLEEAIQSHERTYQAPSQIQAKLAADKLKAVQPPLPVEHDTDTVDSVMKAHGVPVEEQYRGLLELAGKMGVNPAERVNFGVGVSRVLAAPENADLRSEFEGFFKRLDAGTGAQAQTVAQPQTGTATQPQAMSQSQVEEQNLRSDMKELGKLDELQNWGSVLGFVLLSMLIGPQLAFVFFSNSAKKGTLRRQMEMRKENIKRFQEQEDIANKRAYEEKMFMRELSARSAVRGQEKTIDFRQRLFLRATDSAQKAMAQAQKEGNKEKEQYIKDKKAQFNRAITMAKATTFPAIEEDSKKYLELAKSLAEELDILGGATSEKEKQADESEGE